MKRLISFICLSLLLAAVTAFGADAVAPATAAAPATSSSTMAWIMANATAIFAVALAVSEFLALIPGLQGNGILDAIIKALRSLAGKSE